MLDHFMHFDQRHQQGLGDQSHSEPHDRQEAKRGAQDPWGKAAHRRAPYLNLVQLHNHTPTHVRARSLERVEALDCARGGVCTYRPSARPSIQFAMATVHAPTGYVWNACRMAPVYVSHIPRCHRGLLPAHDPAVHERPHQYVCPSAILVELPPDNMHEVVTGVVWISRCNCSIYDFRMHASQREGTVN